MRPSRLRREHGGEKTGGGCSANRNSGAKLTLTKNGEQRSFVKAVTISVMSENENSYIVEGGVNRSDFWVIGCDKPLGDGDEVFVRGVTTASLVLEQFRRPGCEMAFHEGAIFIKF